MDSVRRPFGHRGAENALRSLGATAAAISRRCYRGAFELTRPTRRAGGWRARRETAAQMSRRWPTGGMGT